MQLVFLAFKGKSMTSKVIRFWTRSKNYSHIAMSVDGKLIEAWPHGGNPLKAWVDYGSFENHKEGTEVEIWTLEVSESVYHYCLEQWRKMAELGVPYDWKSIIGFVLKSSKDKKNRLFCSEAAIKPLVEILLLDRINPNHVDPQSFIELIQAMGGMCVKKCTVKHYPSECI